jgi:hypothetical protein
VLYEIAFVAGERVEEGFDEGVLVDEIASLLGPGREDFLLLHLIDGFVGVDGFLDDGGSFAEHFGVGANVIEVGELAVAGNDFHVCGRLGRMIRKKVRP